MKRTRLKSRSKTSRTRLLLELDRLWRAAIRLLCHDRCVLCGATDALQCAHLLHRQAYPHYRNNLMNGVLLCSGHHGDLDGRNGYPAQLRAWRTIARRYPTHYGWVQKQRNARTRPHSMPELHDYKDQLKQVIKQLREEIHTGELHA